MTSACMSPCVATTWPSLTPTMTPQPVPQKRQGAFDHLISSALTPPGTGCANAGKRDAGGGGGDCRRMRPENFTPRQFASLLAVSSVSTCSKTMFAAITPSRAEICDRRSPRMPVLVPSITTTILLP